LVSWICFCSSVASECSTIFVSLPPLAHQPAVRHRPRRHGRQQRHPGRRLLARGDQLGDPFTAQQRGIAGQDHDDPIVGLVRHRRERALHRMAGAALFGLDRDADRVGAEALVERGLHDLRLVTEDRDHLVRTRRTRGGDDPVQQGTPRHLVEHLRRIALHPRSESGGHDENERLTAHAAGSVARRAGS
jgi:hypothetical protein